MNDSNALDGFLARATPVERVARLGPTAWHTMLWLGLVAALGGLLAPVTPSPASIENGGVVVFGIGLEAALAELLRSYGLAAAGLSLLCLMALAIALEVEGVDRAPMLSLILLTGWIGTTASLLVATGLFLLVGLLNIVFWIMLIGLVLSIVGWWGSR
jgi:hypothetical protein